MSGFEGLFIDHGKRASYRVRVTRVSVIAFISLVLIALPAWLTYRGFTPYRWKPISCEIVSSSVDILHDRDHLEEPYIMRAEFRYGLNGKSHLGTQIKLDEKETHT